MEVKVTFCITSAGHFSDPSLLGLLPCTLLVQFKAFTLIRIYLIKCMHVCVCVAMVRYEPSWVHKPTYTPDLVWCINQHILQREDSSNVNLVGCKSHFSRYTSNNFLNVQKWPYAYNAPNLHDCNKICVPILAKTSPEKSVMFYHLEIRWIYKINMKVILTSKHLMDCSFN